jgi:dTDP-4-amino-4,6-dideoxy-D-galactose acyltransferase
MLIVYKMASNATIKDYIFNEMAVFFKAQFPDSEVYKYINDSLLIKKVRSGGYKKVILPHTFSKNLSKKLFELKIVQILIGSNNDLIEFVDIIIDPLEKINLKYFYGKNFLLPALLDGQHAQDIAKHLSISFDDLKSEVEHNNAEELLIEVVSLIYKLEWDTSFFNTNISFLSSICLTKNIENYVKNFIALNKIELVTFRCNCHDVQSVKTAEDNDYSFVDIRLTMERNIDKNFVFQDTKKGFFIQKAIKTDIETLIECGRDIYYSSRYYYDKNFNTSKVDEFYSGWIRKSVLGLFDDFCYALYDNKIPIGFCSIKLNKGKSASIGLLGLNQNYAKLGLGRYMLNKVIEALYKDGIIHVDVVTQGRNYQAQRLYQRCGFITQSTELWYHKWINKIN